MTLIIAIDPGLSGAVVLNDTTRGRFDVMAMPVFKVGKTSRKTLDEEELVSMLTLLRDMGATHLFVEAVGGRPKQSASAAFNFGYGYAVIITTARMLGLVVERVLPQGWKGVMRVPADKQLARARASELLPAHKHLWPLKGDDGKAEAALLALYGERVLAGRTRR